MRDLPGLRAAVDAGVAELGKLDIVSANAGICTVQAWEDVTPAVWQDTIDTNLTGVWNTLLVSIPHLLANGGGSIIATSSTAGIKACRSSARTPPPSTASSASAGRWPTNWPTRASGSTRSTRPAWTRRW